MLTIKIVHRTDTCIICDVSVEGDKAETYGLTIDVTKDDYPVMTSDIPQKYRAYEAQARMALLRYKGKDIPDRITSMWY